MIRSILIPILLLVATPAAADPCEDFAIIAEYAAQLRDRGMTASEVMLELLTHVPSNATPADLRALRHLVAGAFQNAMLSPEDIYGYAYGTCWARMNPP